MWWQAPSDAYHSVNQSILTIKTFTDPDFLQDVFFWWPSTLNAEHLWQTRTVRHISDEWSNTARQFPGDFAISSRFPRGETWPSVQQHPFKTAHFPGLPSTRKVKPIWILLKEETVSGSGISWAICKSATHSRQITMPAPHHSVFYRPDALPAAQPTASKHWSPEQRAVKWVWCVFQEEKKFQ